MNNNYLEKLPKGYPKFLYKFRCFKKNHLDILKNNKVFFASPKEFNDPFDCRIQFRYDLGTKNEKIKHLRKYINREHPEYGKKECYKEADRLFALNPLENKRELQKLMDNATDSALNHIGVFSLSANYSEILSWSHYSNSHAGFCIGFDTLTLLNFCIRCYTKSNNPVTILKVKYNKSYPLINPYKMNYKRMGDVQLTRKSKIWEYEQEYRIIMREGANLPIELPPQAIRKVYIGCETSKDDIKKITSIIEKRKPKVSVYKAETSLDKFKLKFKKINI